MPIGVVSGGAASAVAAPPPAAAIASAPWALSCSYASCLRRLRGLQLLLGLVELDLDVEER